MDNLNHLKYHFYW